MARKFRVPWFASVGAACFLLGAGLYGLHSHSHSGHGGDHTGHAVAADTADAEREWTNNPIRAELSDARGELAQFPPPHRQADHYLVNYWGTWCPPCVHELPLLSEYHSGERNTGLPVVGIAIDEPDKVREFVDRVPLSFESLVAGPAAFDILPRRSGVPPYLPTTFLVDAEGYILAQKEGPFADMNEIEEFVKGGFGKI